MMYNTTLLDNVTNIQQLATETSKIAGDLLFGGILVLIALFLIAGMLQFGFKNAFLASSLITTLLAAFAFMLQIVSITVVTIFLIFTVMSIILRVFGGD